MKSVIKIMLAALALALAIAMFSCGGGSHRASTLFNQSSANSPARAAQPVTEWPQSLPVDGIQPWETTDSNGRVVSSINLQSQFIPGIERFQEAGVVADIGEASSFASGLPGEKGVSWAYYRIPMGAEQPGTIAADVNLRLDANSDTSAYYVGVADYSANTWHWYGPFTANYIRFNVPPASYTSSFGNLFLAIVAYDGADFDLVGLGVNARDYSDTDDPMPPATPTLTPEVGGILVEWVPVVNADLAGYKIYANGSDALGYIEGGTSVFIPASAATSISLSSVDVSGNESPLSDPASAMPLSGAPLVVQITTTAASGVRGDIIALSATGAESYDWDVDGDGDWDVTGDTTGNAFASTIDMGIIRPALRAHTTANGFWMGAVSLIISGNARPVIAVTAAPQSGLVPLPVSFTLTAEDDDGTIAEYAWDYEGDGIYDFSSPANPGTLDHTYLGAGLFNAKFRVTDNDGAWDVDTVAISVTETTNHAPVAAITATPSSGSAPLEVLLDASGSYDPDTEVGDHIIRYTWDIEGDGVYEKITFVPFLVVTYDTPGIFTPSVSVTDSWGAISIGTAFVNINILDNVAPTASLIADPLLGDIPLTVAFDATASTDTDGSIVRYDWDFDGNGVYEIYDSTATPSWTFTGPGNYDVRVRVTDNDGAQGDAFVTISVSVPGNTSPVADLQPVTAGGNIPFTVTFNSSASSDPDGTIVRYDYDFNGDGIWDAYDAPAVMDWTYTTAGVFTARMRVTDNLGAQTDATSAITVNAVPLPVLEATPPEGDIGVTVYFDASASIDTDGTIVDYEWDLDNNGTFNEVGPEENALGLSNVIVVYPAAGEYTVTVRVTDNFVPAATAVASVTAHVHGWIPQAVDATNANGSYSSLGVVESHPAGLLL